MHGVLWGEGGEIEGHSHCTVFTNRQVECQLQPLAIRHFNYRMQLGFKLAPIAHATGLR